MSNNLKQPNSSGAALWLILAILSIFVIFVIVNIIEDNKIRTKQPTYTPASSPIETDWNAYCRDLFPDSPSARESCVRGAKAGEDLMNGKYDR